MDGDIMPKVTIITNDGSPPITHVFLSDSEARAYILGVREWMDCKDGTVNIKLDGRKV
jgi:hypothetical protein